MEIESFRGWIIPAALKTLGRIGVLCAAVLFMLPAGCVTGGRSAGIALEKKAPVVYIHPLNNDYRQAAVGVLPFRVPAGIPAEQGLRVSALYKDVLLGKGAFPVIRQLTEPYGDLEEALKLGRAAGLDLVLAGQIDHLLAAAEKGGARAAVSVRLLDTASGHTVWYVAQSMGQKVDYPDLSFGNRLLSSFSTPPVHQPVGSSPTVTILAQLASELAEVLMAENR